MSDQKPALVLHLVAGGEPLLFGLPAEDGADVAARLPQLTQSGAVESIKTRDESRVTINFAHVAVAYVDDLARKGKFGVHT